MATLYSVCLLWVVLRKPNMHYVREVERNINKDPTCKHRCQGAMNKPCNKVHILTAQPEIAENAVFLYRFLTVFEPEKNVTRAR